MGASDDYLAATLTERATIVGQYLFDAFPDNPNTPEANGVANVRASLQQVRATGQPHEMAPQHYDVPDPALPGRFAERHWLPRHTPVLDAAGQVQFILQSVQDVTASRRAEQLLRESQAAADAARADVEQQRQRFYEVLLHLPAYVAVYQGPDHINQFVNPPYQRMFPHRAFPGRPFREAMPEAVGLGVVALFEQVYRSGEPYYGYEMEGWFDFEDTGKLQQLFFNLCLHPLRDAQGRIDGLLNFSYDVSEQVRARRQVQQLNDELAATNAGLADTVAARTRELAQAQAETEAQRLRLHRLIAEAPALIASLRGPDHRVELANDSFRRTFGGRALVGKPYRDAVPDLTGQPFFDRLDAVYRTGETYFGTDEPMALDRTNSGQLEQIYASYIYQATRNAAGQVDGILIYASEVTEQVLARQQREAEQQQLAELFMQAPAPIVILDGPDLVFQLVNPAYQKIFPGRALAGKPLLEALPELAGTLIPGLLRQVYDSGKTYTVQELPLQMARQEGAPLEIIHWTFTYQARRDAQGVVDGVRAFAHDVSPQVQARQLAEANRQQVRALNQQLAAVNDKLYAANTALADANEGLSVANGQLTRANADLDTFAYTASHDLRTPIANLEGLLRALVEQLPPVVRQDAEVRPLLHLMQGAVDRFQRTLTQLTDIIREDNAPPQPAEAVDLAALVRNVCLDLNALVAAANPQLVVDVAGCPRLTFAPGNLRSILYNLLSNALKYRDPARASVVHVRCRSTESTTVLEVEDNGLGLDQGQQARLFGLFQRLHTHVEGNGVGLYSIKKIVENAGGTIAVRSQPGVGTAFTVTLPVPA